MALRWPSPPALTAELDTPSTSSEGLGGPGPHLSTQQNSSSQGSLCPTSLPRSLLLPPRSFPPQGHVEKGRKLTLAFYSQQERASALWDGVGRAGRHFLGGWGGHPGPLSAQDTDMNQVAPTWGAEWVVQTRMQTTMSQYENCVDAPLRGGCVPLQTSERSQAVVKNACGR